MYTLSSLLKKAALKKAAELLESDLTEAYIPDITGYIVSKHPDPPEGYAMLQKIPLESVSFYIHQLL